MHTLALTLLLAASVGPNLLIPSAPGTFWRYRAAVEWTVADSNVVRSADIDWETTVAATRTSGATTVLVLSGFPSDLCWYEPGTKPSLMALVFRSDGLYLERAPEHEIDAERFATAVLASAPAPDDHVLSPIPHVGDCLGGSPGRTDGLYCWHVDRRVRHDGRPGWVVAYRTNPDEQVVEFVPGLGITRYEFRHHGTVASVRARLVATGTRP